MQLKLQYEYDEKGLLEGRIRYDGTDKRVFRVKFEYEYYD